MSRIIRLRPAPAVTSSGLATTPGKLRPGFPRVRGVATAEAPGGSLILSEDFEEASWPVSPFNTPSGSVALSTLVARSGTRSLMFTYPAAPSSANSEQRFNLGAQYTEVYQRRYIYWPDGTEGFGSIAYTVDPNASVGSNNNKFSRYWADSYDNNKVGASMWPPSNPATHFCYIQADYKPNGTSSMTPVGTKYFAPVSLLGTWVKVVERMKFATVANNDGIYQLSINDTMVINLTTLANYRAAGGNYFQNGYYFGAANSKFTAQTRIWIDDVDADDGVLA